jgi:hypothetical protein
VSMNSKPSSPTFHLYHFAFVPSLSLASCKLDHQIMESTISQEQQGTSSRLDLPEHITLACSLLQSSVERQIGKRQKSNRKVTVPPLSPTCIRAAKDATQHGCHVVQQLYVKRSSLSHGIRAFVTFCGPFVLQQLQTLTLLPTTTPIPTYSRSQRLQFQHDDASASSHQDAATAMTTVTCQVVRLLTHWFRNYLRLRDGLVLLHSGECRHRGDVRAAAATTTTQHNNSNNNKHNHKSKLGQQSTRADGYTTMYSGDHYSGYGWDELFDEHVGVKTRLVLALLGKTNDNVTNVNVSKERKEKMWDAITGRAELFDSCLSEQETAVKSLATEVSE